MIDVYFWPTPNGFKLTIMLEECGLPYTVIPVDIGAGDQFEPDFLKIAPNNKMPAIVDHDGPDGKPYALSESGAILLYLAEKTGKFMPADRGGKGRVAEWLMFQMGTVGPMLGQAHHFLVYAAEREDPKTLEYAQSRYRNEANRLYGVTDRRLSEVEYLAGDYSIADMATMPWMRRPERQGVDIEQYPNVERWREALLARPAVEKGIAVMADRQRSGPMDDKTREMLFGASQYQRR